MKRAKKLVLDDIDKDILRILTCDCRITDIALGRMVNMSRIGARKRISRLEDAGIITGYTAIIDADELNSHLEEGETWE